MQGEQTRSVVEAGATNTYDPARHNVKYWHVPSKGYGLALVLRKNVLWHEVVESMYVQEPNGMIAL